jgi:hypothetical protein
MVLTRKVNDGPMAYTASILSLPIRPSESEAMPEIRERLRVWQAARAGCRRLQFVCTPRNAREILGIEE